MYIFLLLGTEFSDCLSISLPRYLISDKLKPDAVEKVKVKMSGMGDGYVGTAQDAVKIRRLEKQREAERRKIQELKNKTASSIGQPGLLQFGSSTSEVIIIYTFSSTWLQFQHNLAISRAFAL